MKTLLSQYKNPSLQSSKIIEMWSINFHSTMSVHVIPSNASAHSTKALNIPEIDNPSTLFFESSGHMIHCAQAGS